MRGGVAWRAVTFHDDAPSQAVLLEALARLEAAYDEIEPIALNAAGEARHEENRRLAPERLQTLLARLDRGLAQAHDLGIVLAEGFARVRQSPETGSDFTRWRPTMTRHEIATYTLRVFVLVVVGELEHFLREVALWWLTPERVSSIANGSSPPKVLKNKPPETQVAELSEFVKPSGNPNTWPKRMHDVFGLEVPAPLRVARRGDWI